jgi:CYTH domain
MNIGAIDHQVTYSADTAIHDRVRNGLSHHRIVHRVLRSTYFDTADLDLYHRGITLRERSTVDKNGVAGDAKVEAKIPTEDGLNRVAGEAARTEVAKLVGDVVLSPVAVQTKTRALLLTGGFVLAPQFVVALDVAEVAVGPDRQRRYEIEAQIFTSLPWTKRVTAQRVERFEKFCQQLELDFDLSPASESGYVAIMKNAHT